MAPSGSEVDASFYEMVHRIAGPLREEAKSERRIRDRQPFVVTQRIAPRCRAGVPDDSEFFEVKCRDLNRAGFSFLASSRPNFTELVASFSTASEVVYMGARVLHCASVLVYPSGQMEHIHGRAGDVNYRGPNGEKGRPMVLVGCRFTGQMEK